MCFHLHMLMTIMNATTEPDVWESLCHSVEVVFLVSIATIFMFGLCVAVVKALAMLMRRHGWLPPKPEANPYEPYEEPYDRAVVKSISESGGAPVPVVGSFGAAQERGVVSVIIESFIEEVEPMIRRRLKEEAEAAATGAYGTAAHERGVASGMINATLRLRDACDRHHSPGTRANSEALEQMVMRVRQRPWEERQS